MEETLGYRIAKQRKKMKLTQNELAEKLMVSNKAISKWESNKGNPSIEFLPNLSRILCCTTDYLLLGEDIEIPEPNIPIRLDIPNEYETYEDLAKLSHTLLYCESKKFQDMIFESISNSMINYQHGKPSKFYIIDEKTQENDTRETLENIFNIIPTRQPISAPIGKYSHHDSDYIYPATSKNPFIVLLIKNINNLILNEEYKKYLNAILNLGKGCGIYVIAVNIESIIGSFKRKFKTIEKYKKTKYNDGSKAYNRYFVDKSDFEMENEEELKLYENYKLPISFGYIKEHKMFADGIDLLGTLITGVTGSGKSNLLHYLITEITTTYTRKNVQLALIDGKMCEFHHYNKLKNLYYPIAYTKDDIKKLLAICVADMENRYDYLSTLKIKSREQLEDKDKMPYLIIIIDELLEVIHDKDNLNNLNRLMNLGRAVGIIVIAATQAPTEDLIPDCVINSLSTKISFKVLNKKFSKRILGKEGAENLNEKGKMIMIPAYSHARTIQVPYLSDKIIKEIIQEYQ